MIYSRLALSLVILEWCGILAGFAADSQWLLHLFIYGSPLYIAMNLLGNALSLMKNPFFMGILLFHVVKYFCIFKAQVLDAKDSPFFGAVGLEIAYLAYSAYMTY